MTGHANEPYPASEVPQGGTFPEPGVEGPPSIGSPMPEVPEPEPTDEYYPYNDTGQNDESDNSNEDNSNQSSNSDDSGDYE